LINQNQSERLATHERPADDRVQPANPLPVVRIRGASGCIWMLFAFCGFFLNAANARAEGALAANVSPQTHFAATMLAAESIKAAGQSAAIKSPQQSSSPMLVEGSLSNDSANVAGVDSTARLFRYFIFVPVTFAFLAFWLFVWIFTTQLPGVGQNDIRERRLVGRMVRFCYAFTVFSLFFAVLPIAVLNALPSTITTYFYADMAESPVALVLGCVHYKNPEDRVGAGEVACKTDPLSDQWLVNIGGLVLQRLPYSPISPLQASAATQVGAVSDPGFNEDPTDDRVDNHIGEPRYNLPPMTIHNGLTVPFYFVFIALLGAAVSMTRKVPEIQWRYLNEHDPLTAPEARQLLVFQILQFLSAPIIAMAAYAIIAPNGPNTSVALAFAAGFSSDAVVGSFAVLGARLISAAEGSSQKPSGAAAAE
jgi:hypothetical protein